MYGSSENDFEGGLSKAKRVPKYSQMDTLYKQLEVHINVIIGVQYLFAFFLCLLIYSTDDVRVYMMDHPAYLVVSVSSFILCIVAVKFFFIQVRDEPLSLISLVTFSLSKAYLLSFIYCISVSSMYMTSILLLAFDFLVAAVLNIFGITELLPLGLGILGGKCLSFVLLTFFYSFWDTMILAAISTLFTAAYQVSIYYVNSKKKFGYRDYLVSSYYIYSLWLIPLNPDDF